MNDQVSALASQGYLKGIRYNRSIIFGTLNGAVTGFGTLLGQVDFQQRILIMDIVVNTAFAADADTSIIVALAPTGQSLGNLGTSAWLMAQHFLANSDLVSPYESQILENTRLSPIYPLIVDSPSTIYLYVSPNPTGTTIVRSSAVIMWVNANYGNNFLQQ